MAKALDVILVVDVEATCWQGQPPPGEENEIIEVGLCALAVPTLERVERRSILVRPERSRVSDFCTRLTTLTQEQVDGGISFAEACEVLRSEFHAGERVWASYGEYDRRQFERQCAARGLAYPFGRHLNVKTLAALAMELGEADSVAAVLARLGGTFEGTLHRGDDDAWNIAHILAELTRRMRVSG